MARRLRPENYAVTTSMSCRWLHPFLPATGPTGQIELPPARVMGPP